MKLKGQVVVIIEGESPSKKEFAEYVQRNFLALMRMDVGKTSANIGKQSAVKVWKPGKRKVKQ